MKNKYKILHYFLKVNTFCFYFAIMYFVLRYTIGLILRYFISDIYCEIIYLISAILFVLKYCKISSPYEKYIN